MKLVKFVLALVVETGRRFGVHSILISSAPLSIGLKAKRLYSWFFIVVQIS